jgi:hypothetical protein
MPQRKSPTSPDDEIVIHTNPTHLDRVSAWLVLAGWAGCAVIAGYAELLFHMPFWLSLPQGLHDGLHLAAWLLLLPVLVVVSVASTTAEAATEVEVLGIFAAFLRSRMGQRSAFEWANARAHYLRLVELPAGRATCERYSALLRQRTRSWQTIRLKPIRR